jgi:hypothetical protein
VVLSPNGVPIQKRVEGDTYQCPNVPSGADYFLVVQSSSATDTETFGDEDNLIRNGFDSAFHAAYQNPSGQTTVSSYTPLGGGVDTVQVTLTMQQGVIQDIQDQDIDSLMSSLNDFRGSQSSPINFLVSLYNRPPRCRHHCRLALGWRQLNCARPLPLFANTCDSPYPSSMYFYRTQEI